MSGCEEIQAAMADYINRRLGSEDCSVIAMHISKCKRCRDEAALLIQIKENQQAALTDMPKNLYDSAYDKLPGNQPQQERKSYTGILYGALRLAQRTLQFTNRMIQEV